MLGSIRRLSGVWYLPHLWNVGRTKKMEACVEAMVFLLGGMFKSCFMSGSLFLCIMMYVLCSCLCIHSFDVLFVTMYEAWCDLCCSLFDECTFPFAVHPFCFVCVK